MSQEVPYHPPEPGPGAYHYQLVRRAIDIIDSNTQRQLSLEELAREMHMSPAHFQRLFSRWAGVSPKKLHQYLRLGHAKTCLANRATALETADAVGLSGTGRLHDLFVSWEAMSPGEYARKGHGLLIRYGWFDSPFGDALVMASPRGICAIGFAAETGREATLCDLISRWPEARYSEDPSALRDQVTPLFSRAGRARLHLLGAPFQIKIWEALLSIPDGSVSSYSEIAKAAGSPRAVRATGTAIGRNPIGWLIPCHRALRKSGALGGYHWGLPVKRAMLAYESMRCDAGGIGKNAP